MTSERSKRRDFLLLIFISKSISKKLRSNVQQVLKITISDWSETFLFLARTDTVESPFKEISVFIRPQEYGKTA